MTDDDDNGSPYPYAGQRAQATQNLMDMNDLFAAIKTHLSDATQQLSGDFWQIVDDNTRFKQEMREELDAMRFFLVDQKNILGIRSSSNSSSNVPLTYLQAVTTSPPPAPMPPSLSVTPPTPQPAQDVQSQMLTMLMDSFSKLSSALSEKSDSKSDWQKFSGDAKKFHSWYLAIMAQLSLPPWMELYDEAKHDIKTTTTNVPLNGKLYSKLLLALDGPALQSVVSKKYLHANGISLLQDLVQMYKPKKVPEIIAAKTGEFRSTMKRSPNESIDSYFNRFHELLDDLNDAEEPVPLKSAIRHFIFTLGAEFETIQSNYRIGNLPPQWNTQDWPTLLVLCRDYYNSVKPFGSATKDATTNNPTGNKTPGFDRLSYQKKVRQWFLNPQKFCQEIEREQLQHPNKCLFHLLSSHPTESCHVKLECDKIRTAKPTAPTSGNSTSTLTTTCSPQGQLRHVTKEEFTDAEVFEHNADDADFSANNTNKVGLLYFT